MAKKRTLNDWKTEHAVTGKTNWTYLLR